MKILVVDAVPGAADALADSLKQLGWTGAGSATNSDDAVEWINRHGGCDVLVTEVFLQPADGLTLRETIQPHLPAMKTVFTSAHDASAYESRMNGCPFLSAPVAPAALDTLLRTLTTPPPVPAAAPAPASPAPAAASPRPRAVAAAQPSASPQPRAVAAAQPSAIPPQPTPGSVPKSAAQKVDLKAAPAVRAVAAVQAASPKPAAVQGQPKVSAAQSAKAASAKLGLEIELPPDNLVGTVVANYALEARIGKGPMGPIYRARQTNIDRLVRFYVLDPAQTTNPEAVQRFISNASAKAKASNPVIMAVYEAGDSEGVYYYSCEYVPCRSVGQIRESGITLDDKTALAVLKAAAEALDFFAREKIEHDLLTENALLIGAGNRARVANIAAVKAAQPFDLDAEMKRVGEIVLSVLPPTGDHRARELATQLVDPAAAPPSWAAFLQTIAAFQPKAVIADAYKLDAQERAAIRMVEESKKRQRRGMIINTAVSLTLLAAALIAIRFAFFRSQNAAVRDLDQMVVVPGGEFIYQDGQKENLPTFYIGKHEVTIGQYAQFLEFIEKNPDKVAQLEHPDQPKGKSHIPAQWADMKELNPPMPGYYQRARRWGKFHDAALDVNSPVFGVDWFDAYAYAKWKGQRLPTEKEWEKAARGTDGRKFAWGNDASDKSANVGTDFNPDPEKGGEVDGWDRWAPADVLKKDTSPFGAIGMTGNVSEWTSTFEQDPLMSSQKVPVIRGGNYKWPLQPLTTRTLKFNALQSDEPLGFRTASDTAPAK